MPVRKIDIDFTGGNPRARFVPDTQLALVGDLISWANNDPQQAHWPAPVIAGTLDRTGFMSEEIPPDASSRQSFSPDEEADIRYQCVHHPDEKGRVSVVATIPLAALAAESDAPPAPTPRAKRKPKAKPKRKPKPTRKRAATRRAKVSRTPKAGSRKATARRTGGRKGKR